MFWMDRALVMLVWRWPTWRCNVEKSGWLKTVLPSKMVEHHSWGLYSRVWTTVLWIFLPELPCSLPLAPQPTSTSTLRRRIWCPSAVPSPFEQTCVHVCTLYWLTLYTCLVLEDKIVWPVSCLYYVDQTPLIGQISDIYPQHRAILQILALAVLS